MSNRDVDTSIVIDEVRLRPILWNASDPLYKNKDARNKSWEDIVVTLFENVSEKEKQQLGKLIQQRWKTARDAFFRTKNATKRTPSGSAAPRYKKYIYYDELSFLNPSAENEVDESLSETMSPSSVNNDNTASQNSTVPSENTVQEEHNDHVFDSGSSQRPWMQKRKKRQQQRNQENSLFETQLLTVLNNQIPDLAADDMAFFSSLGPILKGFDIEQKLEFRSRVLRDITEIKNYNYRTNSSLSSHSQDITSPPQQDPYQPLSYYTTPSYSGYQTASHNDE